MQKQLARWRWPDTIFSKSKIWDFPGGPVVKNLPSSGGDVGLIPGWGTKIPHATGQLNPCDTTTEPACPRPHVPHLVRSPLATMKIPHATPKTRHNTFLNPKFNGKMTIQHEKCSIKCVHNAEWDIRRESD